MPGRPLHVLLVAHGLAPEFRGGTELYVERLGQALSSAGARVSLLCGSSLAKSEATLERFDLGGIEAFRLHRSGLFVDNWERSYAPEVEQIFARLLADLKPDVVHVHHWIRLTRTLVKTASAGGYPAVVTLHDLWSTCPRCFRVRDDGFCTRALSPEECRSCVPIDPWWSQSEIDAGIQGFARDFRRELELAARRFVPTEAHGRFLAQALGRSFDDFTVLAHGSLGRLSRRPARLSDDGTRILELAHWGHLYPMKGLHLVLEAMRRLSPAEQARLRLHVFGEAFDPTYLRSLLELAEGLNVRWRGPYAPEQLEHEALDWAVIPSIAHESWSFVLDEAIGLGLPVLASRRGSLGERLQKKGLLFEPESVEDCARALRRIVSEPGLGDQLGSVDQALPSMTEHATRLLAHYEEVRSAPRIELASDVDRDRAEAAALATLVENRTLALRESLGREDALRGRVAGLEEQVSLATESVRRHEAQEQAWKSSIDAHREEIERHRRDALVALAAADRSAAETAGERRARELERAGEASRLAEATAREVSEVAKGREAARRLAEELALARRAVDDSAPVRAHLTALTTELAEARRALAAAQSEADRARGTLDSARQSHEEDSKRSLARIEELRAAWSAEQARRIEDLTELGSEIERLRLNQAKLQQQRDQAEARERGMTAEAHLRIQRLRAEMAAETRLTPEDGIGRPTAAENAVADQDLSRALADVVREAEDLELENRSLRDALQSHGKRIASERRGRPTSRRSSKGGLRILYVIHDFLPRHAAGSEIYTYRLAQALRRNHEVSVLCTEAHPGVHSYELKETTFDGLPIFEISHQHTTPWFELSWRDPHMNRLFEEILDRVQPDVVHIQHLQHLSIDFLGITKRRNIPIVFTLHEYWLLCPRGGQMLRADLERCTEPVPTKCADCIQHLRLGAPPAEVGRAAFASRVGRHLSPAIKRVLKRALPKAPKAAPATALPSEAYAQAIVQRLAAIREQLGSVDLFLSPSRFLADTFLRSGLIAEDRLEVSDNGQDERPFQGLERTSSPELRVGYVGTVSEYKGVHVLVEALNRLSDLPDVSGHIHGSLKTFPGYGESLVHISKNSRTQFHGRFAPDEVGAVLSELDVLVVPSLWWENSPLTIHEAYMAGVPLVVSDIGGMAEYVQEGHSGLLFRVGDPTHLSERLRELHDDRGLLARLAAGRRAVKSIEQDAADMERRYSILAARYRSEVPA